MSEIVPFRLHIDGDTADQHEFQGYDGYMALAGFAWTLSLATNYLETGRVRHRGDFPGRHAVRASAPSEGSVLVDFSVWLQQDPLRVLGLGAGLATGQTAANVLYGLVKRVIDRNLGEDARPEQPTVQDMVERRGGDVEALVAAAEPAIRQSHSIIGNGASRVVVLGGHNILNTYDEKSRDYVRLNVEDGEIKQKDFSVSAFNANSGYGSVFDFDMGRNVAFSMSRELLRKYASVFTWGLDQYANKTGKRITVKYWRILSMDGTPKRYIVQSAQIADA